MFTYQSEGETLTVFIQWQSCKFDSGRSFLRQLMLNLQTASLCWNGTSGFGQINGFKVGVIVERWYGFPVGQRPFCG